MLHAPDLLAIALCAGPAGVELGPINIINGLSPDKLYDVARAVVTEGAMGPARICTRAQRRYPDSCRCLNMSVPVLEGSEPPRERSSMAR